MSKFFKRIGFKSMDGVEYYYELETTSYNPLEKPIYLKPDSDKGKALIFCEPLCEYSYRFAIMLERKIKEVSQELSKKIEIHILNAWEKPDEYWKRGWNQLIVNSKVVESFYSTDEFNEELRSAIDSAY